MVPNGWERMAFENIMSFRNGLNFAKLDSGESIKIVGVSNFKNHSELRDLAVLDTINVANKVKDEDLIEKNDLLYVRSNGNKDLIGRCLFFPEVREKLSFSGFTIRGRIISENAMPAYIALLSRSGIVKQQFTKNGGGTNISNLSQQILNNILIDLPPLPEQQKIAKILSTWDNAISTTKRLIENSTQQKKALMQHLLMGKKRLLDESGKRFEGEWNWVNLEDVCDVKGGKRLPKGNAVSEDITPHPYIRVADMYMGGVDLSDIKYVPESIAPLIKNYTISKDDLFITVAGTLGIVGSIPDDLDGANLTENADKLTNIKCDKAFLLYVMTSSVIQRYIEAESTQNAQPKLALARIRGFKVPLPNPEEQQKIATVLTDADREIELLAQQLADLQQEKKALMQVLLTGKKRVVVDGEVV